MVPKHEIFDPSFFPTFNAIRNMGRLFRVQKDFFNPSFFTMVFHFFENTRMLSIRVQFVHVHWAYAYELYAYAQHMLTNCVRMLNICVRKKRIEIVWIIRDCWAYAYKLYAYAEHSRTKCVRTLSVRVQCVLVSSAYAYETLNTLSIRVGNFCNETPLKVFCTMSFKKIV